MRIRVNRFLLYLAAACGLLVGLGVAVVGQSAVRSLLPMVVDVEQVVPIEAVIADADGITATVPLTMTVNVQVRLDGVHLAGAQVMTPTEPVVRVRQVEPDVKPGDPVVNDVWWAIESVERPEILDMGSQEWMKFETRGEFVLLHMALKNVGVEPVEVGRAGQFSRELEIRLVDEEGRAYAPFDTGRVLDFLCENADLNPGFDVPCQIPFEVAEGATGFVLQVANDAGDVIKVPVPE